MQVEFWLALRKLMFSLFSEAFLMTDCCMEWLKVDLLSLLWLRFPPFLHFKFIFSKAYSRALYS